MAVRAPEKTQSPEPYRFTVDEFYKMAEAGIFNEDDRVELIEGEIIQMSPIGDPHMICVNRLTYVLVGQTDGKAVVSVQNPARLSQVTEPEPDVTLFKWRDDFYAGQKAHPEDMLLIVEVSDTTYRYDHNRKLPLYAESGIPEVWIVNLPKNRIEVYTNPVGRSYTNAMIAQKGQTIMASAIAGVSVEVARILD